MVIHYYLLANVPQANCYKASASKIIDNVNVLNRLTRCPRLPTIFAVCQAASRLHVRARACAMSVILGALAAPRMRPRRGRSRASSA